MQNNVELNNELIENETIINNNSKENQLEKLIEEDIPEDDIFSELDEEDEEDLNISRSTDERENAIEWYTGSKTITVTLTQRKLINKVLSFAEKYPEEVKVDKINNDGTVLAHIPLKYLKFQRPRELSEEEKEKARERLAKYRK